MQLLLAFSTCVCNLLQQSVAGVFACQCDLMEVGGSPHPTQPGWAPEHPVVLKTISLSGEHLGLTNKDEWDGTLTCTQKEGKLGSFIFSTTRGVSLLFPCCVVLSRTRVEVLILTDDSSRHSLKTRPQPFMSVWGKKSFCHFLWKIFVSGYKLCPNFEHCLTKLINA